MHSLKTENRIRIIKKRKIRIRFIKFIIFIRIKNSLRLNNYIFQNLEKMQQQNIASLAISGNNRIRYNLVLAPHRLDEKQDTW